MDMLMWKENIERIKAVINRSSNKNRQRGRHKKRWKDKLKKDMKQLELTGTNEYIQQGSKSPRTFIAAVSWWAVKWKEKYI